MSLLEWNRLTQAVKMALPYLTKDDLSYMASIVGMRSAERGIVADVLGLADRRHRLAAPGSSDADMIEIWTECFSDPDGMPNSYRTPAHGLAVLSDMIRALVKEERPNEPNIKAILQTICAPAEMCLPPAGLIYRARCCALAIIVRLAEDERSVFAYMHFITLDRPVSAADLFGRFVRYMGGVGWRDAIERAALAAERSACGLAEYARAARELLAEPDPPPPAAPAAAVCTLCKQPGACTITHVTSLDDCLRFCGQGCLDAYMQRRAAEVARFANAHRAAMACRRNGPSCRDSYMQPDAAELVQVATAPMASSSSSARADCATDYSLPPPSRVAVSSSSPAAVAVSALARIDEARAVKNDTGADELDCPLCMDYKKNVALSCGHTVCVHCFNQSYGGKEAPPCATCRGPVTSYLILYG